MNDLPKKFDSLMESQNVSGRWHPCHPSACQVSALETMNCVVHIHVPRTAVAPAFLLYPLPFRSNSKLVVVLPRNMGNAIAEMYVVRRKEQGSSEHNFWAKERRNAFPTFPTHPHRCRRWEAVAAQTYSGRRCPC